MKVLILGGAGFIGSNIVKHLLKFNKDLTIIDGLLPGPESIMEMINNCWNPEITCNSWIMPDGHTAYIPVIKSIDGTYTDPEFGEIPLTWSQQAPSSDFRSLCPNIIHSIASKRINSPDFVRAKGFISIDSASNSIKAFPNLLTIISNCLN